MITFRCACTGVPSIHLSPSETVHALRLAPMTNVGSHLISNLNPTHLSDATGTYFVPGLDATLLFRRYHLWSSFRTGRFSLELQITTVIEL